MASINSFERILIKTILVYKYGLTEPCRKTDLQPAGADLDIDARTLHTGFFGSKERKGKTILQNRTLEKLIGNLRVRSDIRSWQAFKTRFAPPKEFINDINPLPNENFEDLPQEWQERIQFAVHEVMQSIYPNLESNRMKSEPNASKRSSLSIIDKPELYINTAWHLYFYHEEIYSPPKIGRAILKIGEGREDVELINFKNSESNDYSGRFALDKSQNVLVFDLKTTTTREKWLHIKVSINTGDLPEIALGHYSNLGDGAVSLVSGTIVLEYVPPEKAKDSEAKAMVVFDEDFVDVHLGIKKYLGRKKLNFQKTKAQIFTKEKLLKFVEEYPRVRQKKPENIRLDPQLKVVISCPQTHLTPNRFKEYETACYDLVKLLKEKPEFDVIHYPSKKYGQTSAKRARSFGYFLDRIIDCDILIIFYFDNVPSMCLMELAWAAEHNKAVYFFTVDLDMIPKVFQYQTPSSVQIFPGHASPEDALEYINTEINFLFKNAIPYFFDRNKEQ